jgi:nicotinamide mononucleotide (NMN) deamidase PncC
LLRPDLTVSSHFEHGRVDFTFSLPHGKEPADGLRTVRQGLVTHLGEYIYADQGTTSLEDRVISMLEAREITLSLAEVGSGGALAAALTGSVHAARVLRGAYVAPSLEQLHNLVASSEEPMNRARMDYVARDVAQKTDSLWTVVLGEIRRDEEGRTWLPFLLRLPDGRLDSRQIRLTGTGESARPRLVTELLDQLRRELTKRPISTAGGTP